MFFYVAYSVKIQRIDNFIPINCHTTKETYFSVESVKGNDEVILSDEYLCSYCFKNKNIIILRQGDFDDNFLFKNTQYYSEFLDDFIDGKQAKTLIDKLKRVYVISNCETFTFGEYNSEIFTKLKEMHFTEIKEPRFTEFDGLYPLGDGWGIMHVFEKEE